MIKVMNDKKIDLDLLFSDVENLVEKAEQKQSNAGITIWLPLEYKQKYSHLQAITDRKFALKMKELFMKALDKVNL
jgi:hypothetical protein